MSAKGKMVGVGRFELPTSCTPSKRASQATLHPDTLNYCAIEHTQTA